MRVEGEAADEAEAQATKGGSVLIEFRLVDYTKNDEVDLRLWLDVPAPGEVFVS